MSNTTLPRIAVLAALLMSLGCKSQPAEPPGGARAPGGATLPASLSLSEAPAGAKPVSALKAQAAQGDEVVIRAYVGGRKEPLAGSSAVMTVVDASLHNACYAKGHSCPTPWDYCCADRQELARHQASVQVLGPDGRVLRTSLSERLKPGDLVHVVGTVAPRPAKGLLVIHATGIHVGQGR